LRILAAIAGLMLATANIAAAQTVLNLSADGSNSVDPDRITASLAAQSSSPDAARAQADVNQAMAQALAAAHSVSGVTATTGDYSVYQTTPSDGSQKTVFQASQNLQLDMAAPDGAPAASFTALVGKLQQQGLLLNSLNGDLSDQAQEAAQQGAIDDAIRQIRAQAQAVAATLGERVGRIQTLNVNINMPGPVLRAAPMMMMAAAAPPPQAAPPKVSVQANVSATIALTAGP
jgi:predicted secreted protein